MKPIVVCDVNFVKFLGDSLPVSHNPAVIFHVAKEVSHNRVSNFERDFAFLSLFTVYFFFQSSTMIKLYLIAIVCATGYVNSGKHYLWYSINCPLH